MKLVMMSAVLVFGLGLSACGHFGGKNCCGHHGSCNMEHKEKCAQDGKPCAEGECPLKK